MVDHADDLWHFAEDYPMAPLDEDCRLLGSLLDDTLRIEVGDVLFEKIGRIRGMAQAAAMLSQNAAGDASKMLHDMMEQELSDMPLQEALPTARALGHYLNLTSVAENFHNVRMQRKAAMNGGGRSLDDVLGEMLGRGITPQALYEHMCKQSVEIVLTAHPTQVNRRTLQHKHNHIAKLLERNDRIDLTPEEREGVIEDMVREITALWQTDEIRRRKPTPMDEVKGGLHVIEQSLWTAVPNYLRKLSASLKKHTGQPLPINVAPISFGSWMGGDRDGNPNVTAEVTKQATYLARWIAADLYIKEVDVLRFELSMSNCSDELFAIVHRILRQKGAEAAAGKTTTKDHTPRPNSSRAAVLTRGASPSMILGRPSFMPAIQGERDASTGMADVPPGAFPTGATPKANGASAQNNFDLQPLAEGLTPEGGTSPHEVRSSSGAGNAPAAHGEDLEELPAQFLGADGSGYVKHYRHIRGKSLTRSSMDAIMRPRIPGLAPYRLMLTEIHDRLVATREHYEALLAGRQPDHEVPIYLKAEDVAQPLLVCYRSLWDCGSGIVAEGRLADLLRRLYTFGLHLVKLDVRQESTRHADTLDTITEHLELGKFSQWTEEEKCQWIISELKSKRPLIPHGMPMSEDVREVLNTFRMVAENPESLGAYVISMAHYASDVLAVELLQREATLVAAGERGHAADFSSTLRVVPLFETRDDLTRAPETMTMLFNNPWYRHHLAEHHNDSQEIMLGYSDSGKDAGRLAANWALYRAQEQLTEVSRNAGVKQTLFHGRGGTIGRGGGPMYLAIQSQPPGSVEGRLRVTEQGEMVQAKFGLPVIAQRNLEVYTTAILASTLAPPNPPRSQKWREILESLAEWSCEAYREIVFRHPKFVSYFRHATPEEELVNLNIGSRPQRRKKGGGVETLRAIPWIFAWTQNRLVLPAWLGFAEAIDRAHKAGWRHELQAMYREWPFFQSTIDLVEMILAKADMRIAKLYDTILVADEEEKALGEQLRRSFKDTVQAILGVSGHSKLIDNNHSLRRLIQMRNPYIDPLNVLQVEILRRLRQDPDNQDLREALLITINGLAAGMRNTG
ncbi:unnamed protein product [Pedinophyceae sp. YPF-701]|nr:unnamed protein product [Pedinophyceae sp. YPF-701]